MRNRASRGPVGCIARSGPSRVSGRRQSLSAPGRARDPEQPVMLAEDLPGILHGPGPVGASAWPGFAEAHREARRRLACHQQACRSYQVGLRIDTGACGGVAPLRRSPPHLSGRERSGRTSSDPPRTGRFRGAGAGSLPGQWAHGVGDMNNLVGAPGAPGATDGRVDPIVGVNALLLATRVVHRLSIP